VQSNEREWCFAGSKVAERAHAAASSEEESLAWTDTGKRKVKQDMTAAFARTPAMDYRKQSMKKQLGHG